MLTDLFAYYPPIRNPVARCISLITIGAVPELPR